MSGRTVKAIVAVLIIAAAVSMDQGTKHSARAALQGKPPVLLVDHVLVLRYVENEGAFLSLGSALPRPIRTVAFVAFPLLVLGWMTAYFFRKGGISWGAVVGFSLIAGGGAGNLIDRLFRGGRVGDFIMVGIGSVRTGIFNVADLAVLAGCAVLLFSPGKEKLRTSPTG